MIDQISRNRLMEDRKTKTLVDGMKESIIAALKAKSEGEPANEEVLKLVVKREDEPKLLEKMGKIGDALAMVYKAVTRPLPLPRIFQVKGDVRVTQNAPTRITNLSDLDKNFKSLESMLRTFAQAAAMAPAPQIKIPDFPKISIPKLDTSKLEEMIGDLIEKTGKPSKGNNDSMIAILNRVKDSIDALVDKPTYIPQPATNVQINALQGVAKTTAVTVTTSLTRLPDYGQLFNRRSLIIYNNGSNTVFIGGSDVTSSNGLPVPASTYSPPIDAGYNMVIYGVTSSSTSDVRVMEVSKDTTNNVQQ